MAWDLEEVSFMVVGFVDLKIAPFLIMYKSSSFQLIVYLFKPCTNMPVWGSSQIYKFGGFFADFVFASKSVIFSR